jgi:hypothetical protein
MDPHFNALPGTKPVSLVDFNEKSGCRWPIGEHPTLFCNAWTSDKKPQYCTRHGKMAYRLRGVTTHGNVIVKR